MKSASQQDSETLLKAVEELQEGAKALAFRQKLIRLADRSEFGWDAVKEYETDELAENDDNAKRLEKAEKSAEQKALKRRKTAQYRYGRGRGRRAQGYAAPHNQQMPASSGVQAQVPPGVFQFRGNAGSSGQRPRVPGPCFNCTEMGHIRANCPKLSKPYPLTYPLLVVIVCHVVSMMYGSMKLYVLIK